MFLDFLLGNRAFLQNAGFLALALIAFWRGAGPEKWAATTFVCAIAAVYIYRLAFPVSSLVFRNVNLGFLTIDILIMLSLTSLALVANRIYPLWLLAAQLIATMMHLHREFLPIKPVVYFVLTIAPSYVQLVGMALGLWAHRKRVESSGPISLLAEILTLILAHGRSASQNS